MSLAENSLPVDIAQQVRSAVAQVLADYQRSHVAIGNEDRLREGLGLDSLDLALIVVRLEQTLGVDPFRRQRGPVRTFGELVAAYEHELKPSS